MRRALAVLASIGLAAGTIALATPAHAASSITDNGNGSVTIVLDPDDAVYFCSSSTVSSACGPTGGGLSALFSTITGGTFTGGSVLVPTSDVLVAGTYTVVIRDTNTSLPYTIMDQMAPVVITGGGGGGGGDDSGSTGATGSAPASVMQQFGLPASGNCEDGYSDSMNWSGVGNGGWGISWAQWVNDGAGGAVCSRTVMYDTSTAKWTVN